MSLFDEVVGIPAKPKRKPRPRTSKTPKATPKPKLDELPEHVKGKLRDAGAMDDSLAGPPAVRKAHMITCPKCGRHVMRGLLSMPTPWPVDADPPALSLKGEALALLTGRKTYNLHWRYDHYELEFRGTWDWVHPNDKKPGQDILCEHRCSEPANFTTQHTRLPPLKTSVAVELPDLPPF